MNIAPIETRYKGYRFRSRLEARWAVFFDTLGIEWEYEPQGFVLPSGPYLPDFQVPGHYIEVKPRSWTGIHDEAIDRYLVSQLEEATGIESWLIAGNPWPGEYRIHVPGEPVPDSPPFRYSYDIEFASCRRCETGVCAVNADPDAGGFLWGDTWGPLHSSDCSWNGDKQPVGIRGLLQKAFAAARGARFEHGERG